VFAALQALLDADAHGVARSQQEASRARVTGAAAASSTSDGSGVELDVGLGNSAAVVAASSADSFDCGCSVVVAPSHATRLAGAGVSSSFLVPSSGSKNGRWDALPIELAMCDAEAGKGGGSGQTEEEEERGQKNDANAADDDDEVKDATEAAMVFSKGTLAAVQAPSSSMSSSWVGSGGSVSLNRAVKLLCSLRRLVEAEASAPANTYARIEEDDSSTSGAVAAAAAATGEEEQGANSAPLNLQQFSALLLNASWVWQSPSLEVKLAQQLQPLAVVTGAVLLHVIILEQDVQFWVVP